MKELQPFLKNALSTSCKLSDAEEKAYFNIIQSDKVTKSIKDMAMNKIIQNHILFVVSVAKKFSSKTVELTDLIQEGILGMKYAATKYDINSGTKFLSYAVWYIVQRIKKYLDSYTSAIYIPVNQKQEVNKINRRMRTENKTLNELGLSNQKILDFVLVDNAINIESLNSPLPGMDNETTELIDVIEDNSLKNDIDAKDLAKKIEKIMGDLPERDKKIILKHYGVGEYEPTTLVELAIENGLSHQRLTSLKKQIMHKIRKNTGVYSYDSLMSL